jgi:hypothetical protein
MKAECHAFFACTATLQLSLHARYDFVASSAQSAMPDMLPPPMLRSSVEFAFR